jgi:hypothetical protein
MTCTQPIGQQNFGAYPINVGAASFGPFSSFEGNNIEVESTMNLAFAPPVLSGNVLVGTVEGQLPTASYVGFFYGNDNRGLQSGSNTTITVGSTSYTSLANVGFFGVISTSRLEPAPMEPLVL